LPVGADAEAEADGAADDRVVDEVIALVDARVLEGVGGAD
jgi:hypothetical protein